MRVDDVEASVDKGRRPPGRWGSLSTSRDPVIVLALIPELEGIDVHGPCHCGPEVRGFFLRLSHQHFRGTLRLWLHNDSEYVLGENFSVFGALEVLEVGGFRSRPRTAGRVSRSGSSYSSPRGTDRRPRESRSVPHGVLPTAAWSRHWPRVEPPCVAGRVSRPGVKGNRKGTSVCLGFSCVSESVCFTESFVFRECMLAYWFAFLDVDSRRPMFAVMSESISVDALYGY